jgi:hypothetical protein
MAQKVVSTGDQREPAVFPRRRERRLDGLAGVGHSANLSNPPAAKGVGDGSGGMGAGAGTG